MKKIEIKSLENYNKIYKDLINKMKDGSEKTLIKNNETKILELFKLYYDNIINLEIFESSGLSNETLKEELIKKFESSDNFKKNIRNLIKLSKCPYCGFKSLEESIPVEHYLPKSKFQEFSLLGLNLFLCCTDCNSRYKRSKWQKGDRLFLNPYIDDLYNKKFINLEIDLSNNMFIIDISINKDSSFSDYENKLLENHFREFNLISRISKYLNKDISKIIGIIKRYKNRGKLKEHLEDIYEDYLEDDGLNSIKAILYKYFIENPHKLEKLLEFNYK